MPGTSSPIDDIISFLLGHIYLVIIVLIAIFSSISKAMRGAPRPPLAGPGSLPSASVPPPIQTPTNLPRPTTLPRPQAQSGQRFRPQLGNRPAGAPAPKPGSNAEQLAQERADIERFAQEERELQAAEPEAIGTPLTSSAAGVAPEGTLFAPTGPLSGSGLAPSLLRAIVLAEALGRPRAGGRRPPPGRIL